MNIVNHFADRTFDSISSKFSNCCSWKGKKVTYIIIGSSLASVSAFSTLALSYGITYIPTYVLGAGLIATAALTCFGGCFLCCNLPSENMNTIDVLECEQNIQLLTENTDENIEKLENMENELTIEMHHIHEITEETIDASRVKRENILKRLKINSKNVES